MYQQTIAEKVSCTGIGLHSGAPAQLDAASGARGHRHRVRAHRLGDAGRDPGALERVTRRALATTLGRGDATRAAPSSTCSPRSRARHRQLRGRGRRPRAAGHGRQRGPVRLPDPLGGHLPSSASARRLLRIRRPIEVRDGDRAIRVEPARELQRQLRGRLRAPGDRPPGARARVRSTPERFAREISARAHLRLPARGARALARGPRARRLARQHRRARRQRVLNPEGLRFPDEFVRHKVLDLCGDLALLGLPRCGHVGSSAAATRCTSSSSRRSSPTPTRGRSGARSRARRQLARWPTPLAPHREAFAEIGPALQRAAASSAARVGVVERDAHAPRGRAAAGRRPHDARVEHCSASSPGRRKRTTRALQRQRVRGRDEQPARAERGRGRLEARAARRLDRDCTRSVRRG